MIEVARIIVYGRPAPQGSKRHVGRGIMVESSKHVQPWRDAVRASAAELNLTTLDEPLAVSMTFTFARPKSHYRTANNAHLLRDQAPPYPIGYPDLSKLARSTEDALVDAGILRDDALIVTYTRLAKVYALPAFVTPPPLDYGQGTVMTDTLTKPGAVIRIGRIQ